MVLRLPDDFKEFLRLLNEHKVEYLLVGGYAVSYYGYARSTADMDIWVRIGKRNAQRVVNALRDFGFDVSKLKPELFLSEESIVRMGIPPMRLEIMTDISGIEFKSSYNRRERVAVGDVEVTVIALSDLIKNKLAAARPKDLLDAQELHRVIAKRRLKRSKRK